MLFSITFILHALVVLEVSASIDDSTVSSIFKDAKDGNICDLKNGKCSNEVDETIKERTLLKYGPKFQKVHLELPRINPVRTGYIRKINIMKDRTHQLKTLAIHPPIFEIKDFLTDDECSAIIYLAKQKGMKNLTKVVGNINFPPVNLHVLYDNWDRNLDGLLSIQEVSEIQEIKHLLLTKEDIKTMYSELGIHSNDNDEVTFGELDKATFERFQKYLNDLNAKRAKASVHNIEHTWLWHDEDELLVYDDVLQNYHERLSNLTKIPSKLIEESEPLQVTMFKNGSYGECRHDSEIFHPDIPCCLYGFPGGCRVCRFLSVMYFLNDVEDGELVFPLAGNKTFDWNRLHEDTIKSCSNPTNRSISNLVIKPERGKAIFWYNHYIGRDTGWISTLDPLSFHGANYVNNGDKWIATTWINIIGDGVNELKPWRMGSNLLSANNIRKDIIEQMRNDDFIEGETYLHDAKLIAIEQDDESELTSEKKEENAIVDKSPSKTSVEETEKQEKEHEKETLEVVDGTNLKQSQSIVEDEKILSKSTEKSSKDLNKGEGKISDKSVPNENLGTVQTDEKSTKKDVKNSKNDTGVDTGDGFKDDGEKREKIESEKSTNKQFDAIGEKRTESQIVLEEGRKSFESNLKKSDDSIKPKLTVPNNRNRSPEDGEGPLGPPVRLPHPTPFNGAKMIENRLVTSVLILIEELTRDELEIIARSLHEKLQLACIPIMVNPIGPM